MADMTPFSTAKPLLSALPQWIGDEQERQRIASYALYEAIYWGVPDTFKLVSRGAEDKPIYVPAARTIVETMHRYLAANMSIGVDPAFGEQSQQDLAMQVMTDLKAREKLISKFSANKRYGIMRGDWAFHLYADPSLLAGSRISVMPVDPASLFPIYNPDNVDQIIGWHVVDPFIDNDGKTYMRRLTYRKQTGVGGPSPIDVTDDIFEMDEWGGPGMDQDARPLRSASPARTLPSPIDHLPIYHLPNFDEPGNLWGSSEFRGLERIFAAINQSISDEELTLALEGLGVYTSDAGTPQDDEGNDAPWNLGPGRVVELPKDTSMVRVSGVHTVLPYQDHLKYLHDQIDQAVGMSNAAKGRVDVSVAESGVALWIEMAPLMARVAEKELVVTDVLGNMLYDLGKWFSAYEGTMFNSLWEATRWVPKYGAKLPTNREKEVDLLLRLAAMNPPIVPMSYVRTRLRSLGYEDMPDETSVATAIAAEQQAAVDTMGSRVDRELDQELEDIEAAE